jgi:zinc protease
MDFVNQVMNAELSQVRNEDRDITSIGSFVEPGTRASILICQVKLREGSHPQRSAEHVMNLLSQMWLPEDLKMQQQMMRSGGGMAVGELSNGASGDRMSAISFSKMRLEAATGLALDSEDVRQRAPLTAAFTHFTGDPAVFSRKIKAMSEMEEARIAKFAERYLKRDRARMVYVTPMPASAQVKGGANGVGATDENATQATFSFDSSALTQLAHPTALATELRTFKLGNGLEVVLGRRSAVPMVTIELGFHGGRANAEPAGAGDLERFFLEQGSRQHGDFTNYGARGGGGNGIDSSRFELQAGAGNLENMLAILYDRVSSLRVPAGRSGDFKTYIAPTLRKEEERPEAKADRAFWKRLYEDHPYGRRATVADLEKIDGGAVERWVHRIYNPANAVLVIIGDIDLDRARTQVEKWLGPWKADGQANEVPAPQPPLRGEVDVQMEGGMKLATGGPERVIVTHRPGGTQGEFRLGCLLPAGDAKSYVKYDVMADMVGKHLFKAIRQELGASYGMNGFAQTLRGGASHMLVVGNINNLKLAAALKVIRAYWDGLPAGKFDEQEMNRARWWLAREYNLRFTTTSSIAGEVLAARNLGWGIDSIDHYPEYLAAITKADLQRAFAACHENQVLSIVGDQTAVNAALKESWR